MNPYVQLLWVCLFLFSLVATASEPVKTSVRAIVQLDSRLDLAEYDNIPREHKALVVTRSLREFHEKRAAHLYRWLRTKKTAGDVHSFTPLWIVNSIRVHASHDALESLKDMEGVSQVTVETPKEMDALMPGAPDSSPARSRVSWAAMKIGADKLWQHGYRGQGVVVAMIDSGATIAHPDLNRNVWRNPGETGRDLFGKDKSTNGRDDDGNGYVDDVHGWDFENEDSTVEDIHGHGTQTAGVVGGDGQGGTATGMAPSSTLMILKSCCSLGTQLFESNTWEAIQYAVQNGAKVISMSLSVKHYSKPSYAQWRQVSEAVLATGVIHINSAGNRGSAFAPHNIGAPASNPPAWFHLTQTKGSPSAMLTVGATDETDRLRYYSSTGPVTWESVSPYGDYPYEDGDKNGLIKPEICAPSEIPSLDKSGTGYTADFAGTSSATPVVAGVTALLLSAKPHLSQAQVTEAIQRSAKQRRPGLDNECGAGRIDAVAAMKFVTANF